MQGRFVDENPGQQPHGSPGVPLDVWSLEQEELAAAGEVERDFTPEEVAALSRIQKCLEAAATSA
jgi:hypothetical protein